MFLLQVNVHAAYSSHTPLCDLRMVSPSAAAHTLYYPHSVDADAVSGCDRQTILTRDTHTWLHSDHILTEQFQFTVQDIRQLQLCVSMACTITKMLCIIKCHDVDIFSLLDL